MITDHQLARYLGKSIAEICPNAYADPADTHSAHFVSHVLGYQFGATCQMLGKAKGPAASLRVQNLFAKCRSVGVWSLRPSSLTPCLVFITRAANVNLSAKVMADVPRKHVGILANGFVWHYSNSQQKVVRQTPSQFAEQHAAPDNAMFFGALPGSR